MATIGAIALGNSDLNILVNALQFIDDDTDAGLIAALTDDTADFTVFAPTDAAFTQLATDLGFVGDTSDEGAVTTFLATTLGADTLLSVVQYHVSLGGKTAAELSLLDEIDTLNGATIGQALPRLRDGEPDLLDPSVTAANIAADNGVVHLIDRVLLPEDLPGNDAPTIAGLVAASGDSFDTNGSDFDILLKAVQTAGLVDALNNPESDLTVFAPTDDAFVGLATALGFEGSDEEGAWGYLVDALTLLGKGDPIGLLEDILLYHVTPESVQSSQVLASDGGSVETLLGATIGIDGTNLVDNDPEVPNPGLVDLDIQAKNGVVHSIDGVLLPVDVLPSNGTEGPAFKIGDDGFNLLVGGRDNDFLSGRGSTDLLFAGGGNDVALGGDGRDGLSGGSGRDHLLGGAGDDIMTGGYGKDTLDGGTGNDAMLGDGGADTFVFGPAGGTDWILDFGHGADKIDLTAFELDGLHQIGVQEEDDYTALHIQDTTILLYEVEAEDLSTDSFLI